MYKVGIIGPESSGKSTLAQYLANRYKGTYVPEYAREYVEHLNRPYTYEDVESIAQYQIKELEAITHNPSPITHNPSSNFLFARSFYVNRQPLIGNCFCLCTLSEAFYCLTK